MCLACVLACAWRGQIHDDMLYQLKLKVESGVEREKDAGQ